MTAIVLFGEAVGVALFNWFLGSLVDHQNMSLAGLDPDRMALSSKVGGLVFGLYFLLCGVAALAVCVRNRPPAGIGRILLISVAVVHGLLGAFAVGLVGWQAFAFTMVVLALVVLTLMTYDRTEEPHDAAPPAAGPPAGDGDTEAVAPGGAGGPQGTVGLREGDGGPHGGQGAGGGTVTAPGASTAP